MHDGEKKFLFSFDFIPILAILCRGAGRRGTIPLHTSQGSGRREGCCGKGQTPCERWGEALPVALPHTTGMAKVSCCVLGKAHC